MKKQINTKAFTLVELIVVITILAILGTIAFISFQGYSRDSRDSVRISDMNNIEKAMELILLKGSKLPLPENNINLTASGELIGYQGYVGLDSLNKLGVNNGGLDPLDNKPYTYVTTKDLNKYQILGFLEQDTTSSINTLNLLENTYSADYSSRFPVVKGNNLGVLLSSGSLEPVQVIGNDIDIVLTSNSYEVILSNLESFSGTGNEIGKIELSYKYGVYGSCDLLLQNNKGLKQKDGIYLISPSQYYSFKVFCDMTTDGGGWTMLSHAIGEDTSVFDYYDIASWTPRNSGNCNLEDECLSESGLYVEDWDELMVYTRGYKVKGEDCNDKNLSIKGYTELPLLARFGSPSTDWYDETRGAHGKCGDLSEVSQGKILSKLTPGSLRPIHMGIRYTSNEGQDENALLFFGPTTVPQGLGTSRYGSRGKIYNHYGTGNDKVSQTYDWDGASTQEQTWFIR